MPIIYFLLKKVILPKLGVQDPKNQFSVMFTYFSVMAVIAFVIIGGSHSLAVLFLFLLGLLETIVPNYVAHKKGWTEED